MNKTIATVTIYYRGSADVEITEADIKTIVEKYDGDYEEFILNIKANRSDIDFDREDSEYNPVLIQKAINLYSLGEELAIKVHGEMVLDSFEINQEIFEKIAQDENIAQLFINKEVLKLVCDVADSGNPRKELDYVYFDECSIVATDTKRLIVCENKSNAKDIFIHKAFCVTYAEDENASLFRTNSLVLLRTKEKYYAYSLNCLAKFPDYNRVVLKDAKYSASREHYMNSSVLYKEQDNKEKIDCDVRALKIAGEKRLCLDESQLPKFEFATIAYNAHNLSVMFEAENIKHIVMPMIFKDKELDELQVSGE